MSNLKPHSTTVSATDFESVDSGSNPDVAAKTCPYCKGTGIMWEINYHSWYDIGDAPNLDEVIETRPCSYCMGRKHVR